MYYRNRCGKMKILFLTNLPSPYMIDFFSELGKRCELTVIFERASSSERGGRWDKFQFVNFQGIILKGIPTSVDSALSIGIFKYLNKGYDHIIISNPMTPTSILAMEYMRFKRVAFIIESEGSFPKNGKGLKEKIKTHVIKGADAYFSSTERTDEYFLAYGADKAKIYHYPFTSLYKNEIIDRPLKQNEKDHLRKVLGLKGERIVVAVGRLISIKRYKDLLTAWLEMPANWQLYILGEGEEKNDLQNIINENCLCNAALLGYKEKKELMLYYKAADLFVHPTSTDVWGLVINEAMACGLPIITTNMCIAGDALVKNGENGYIIPVGDISALGRNIRTILDDNELINKMSANSLNKIKGYTFEDMAEVHMNLLNKINSTKQKIQ